MKIAFIFNRQTEKTAEQAEFDTPETIEAIRRALASEGDEVIEVEMNRDGSWTQTLAQASPNLIFNTAEGFHGIGRESLGPIVFEQLQIPYVGSGPYCCFLTLDKFLTKQVVKLKDVNVADGYFVTRSSEVQLLADEMTYPVFVKPNFEGSSKGITSKSLCKNREEFISYALDSLTAFPEGLLVERFIPGKDVAVSFVAGIGDGGVMDPVEYTGTQKDGNWIYDYDLKNLHDEEVGVKCPADISEESTVAIKEQMKNCVQALGVVDMGRADFRVTPSGEVYFIEFNALPSLQPGAGVFESTKRMGLTYNETIQKILAAAIERMQLKRTRVRPGGRFSLAKPNVALVYNLKRKHHGDADYEDEAEFDSQTTIESIATAIKTIGHGVHLVEADKDLAGNLLSKKIDVVFNIAEGINRRGREAQVPAVCDLLGVEHTGSDATCLAVTLDKAMSNKLITSEGILAPRSRTFNKATKLIKHDLNYPLIVKPNLEGTSKGVYDSSVVETDEELRKALGTLWEKGFTVLLVEEYIQGREFTIGLLGQNHPLILGPTEIVFKSGKYPVYSFEAKQLDDQLDNERFKMVCPADLTEKEARKIKIFARRCFRALGARDVARIDFRMKENGDLYFIEMNPLPGLSPGFSDLTIMAEKCGMNYEKLIGNILKPAITRWRRNTKLGQLKEGE